MKSYILSPGMNKAYNIVYDENMIISQQKRLTSKRLAFDGLTLLMTYRFFYNAYHELWPFVIYLIRWVLKVPIEAVNSLPELLVSFFLSASDTFSVFEHPRPSLPAGDILIRQDLREPYQVQRARSCP